MSNVERTPIYSDGNQIIGYRDASEEQRVAASGSQEARLDTLEASVAAILAGPAPEDVNVFKSDFMVGLYDTAAGSGVFQDAYGDVIAVIDANAKAIFPDQGGKFLQSFGSTVVAAPAYDGSVSIYRDDIGFGGGAAGTMYFAVSNGANQHFKLFFPAPFHDASITDFEIIVRVGGHTGSSGGATGSFFIGFREGTGIIGANVERVGIENDWATPDTWALRVRNANTTENITGTPGITLTAGGNTWKWMRVTFVASTKTLSLYQRTAGAWALVDSIVLTDTVFSDQLGNFTIEATALNGAGGGAAVAFDYISVQVDDVRADN